MTGSVLVSSGMIGGFSGTLFIIYKPDLKKYFDWIMKLLIIIGIILKHKLILISNRNYINYFILQFIAHCKFICYANICNRLWIWTSWNTVKLIFFKYILYF